MSTEATESRFTPPEHERLCMAITRTLVESKVGAVIAIGAMTEVLAQLAMASGSAKGTATLLRSAADALDVYAANRRLQ